MSHNRIAKEKGTYKMDRDMIILLFEYFHAFPIGYIETI
jgi:hypothetical protein